jgi:type IV secretory pathway TrbD component
MPRVVRLGRAANDNACLSASRARLILIGVAAAALALAASEWMFGFG